MFPLLLALAVPSITNAYTWNFTNTPAQCQTLSLEVSGGGTPPFRAFVQTFGPTTTSTGKEVRRELDLEFNSSTSLSFQLRYPENSQFVVVVSDVLGFASGGTSVASTVQQSDDASCFDPNTQISSPWTYAMTPPSQLVQCQSTRLWWTDGDPQGTPTFYGIIPGGESFQVPQGAITTVEAEGTGFSWTPNVRTGTTVILAAGDDRGVGSGGSTLFIVSPSNDNDDSCLSGTSPSSTPGSPAGGTYPTATNGAGTGSR